MAKRIISDETRLKLKNGHKHTGPNPKLRGKNNAMFKPGVKEKREKIFLKKYGVTGPSLVPWTCNECGKSGKGLGPQKRHQQTHDTPKPKKQKASYIQDINLSDYQMFLDNKYSRIYINLIQKAQNRDFLEGYYEKHHILPKSLGGSNKAANLVKVTAKEHFICHRLLVKMTSGPEKQKMSFALHAMCTLKRGDRYVNARVFEELKIQISAEHSRRGKLRTGEKNANYGHKWTKEQRDRMSAQRKGVKAKVKRKKRSTKNMSASAKKRCSTPEHKQKFSSMVSSFKFVCEKCGTAGSGKANYNRWHGENCRGKRGRRNSK